MGLFSFVNERLTVGPRDFVCQFINCWLTRPFPNTKLPHVKNKHVHQEEQEEPPRPVGRFFAYLTKLLEVFNHDERP
jgi:hypothetical protein